VSSPWQTYGWFVLGGGALCLAEAAAIGALLFQRARRRAEAGGLSSTLAHELSQPLTAILANAQAASRLLERDPPDLAEVRQCLIEIVESDKHAAGVLHRLRSTGFSSTLVN